MAGLEPLAPELVACLATPEAHPDDPDDGSHVAWVQTHISHVFLTRQRVYKLRKAVDLPFLHFATRAERDRDCLREVALNRRLAPDVYLGVAPVVENESGYRVGRVAESLTPGAVEHCVVMRRLPVGRDALSLLESGALGAPHLASVARVLARFHAAHRLGPPPPWDRESWLARVAHPVRENVDVMQGLADGLDAAAVGLLGERAEAGLEGLANRLDGRRRRGRIVDGHGDLHLQHIWFEGGPETPLFIDCIEFNDELRCIDSASEVAFLAMDLGYRRRADLAAAFLDAYAAEADDHDLFAVVDWYAAYRAAVRAKVAALAASDPDIEAGQRSGAAQSAERHLSFALSLLATPAPGPLVVLCGTVGSGKSSAARALAQVSGGVVISSDRTRKHMAGVSPGARAAAPPGEGLYTDERTDAVYAGLLERAESVLAAGRTAILDATFSSARQRERARAWAAGRGIRAWLVEVHCPADVARGRLECRAAEGRDPSDAGPELLETSLARWEPPDEWPAGQRRALDTSEAHWPQRAADLAREIAGP